jgi:hypothetical protein
MALARTAGLQVEDDGTMVKGIRIILAGGAALVLGGILLAVPAEVGIAWYEPASAFLAGLLIALGVYTISRGR